MLEAVCSENGTEAWWDHAGPELAEAGIDPGEGRLDRRRRAWRPAVEHGLAGKKRSDRTIVSHLLAGIRELETPIRRSDGNQFGEVDRLVFACALEHLSVREKKPSPPCGLIEWMTVRSQT